LELARGCEDAAFRVVCGVSEPGWRTEQKRRLVAALPLVRLLHRGESSVRRITASLCKGATQRPCIDLSARVAEAVGNCVRVRFGLDATAGVLYMFDSDHEVVARVLVPVPCHAYIGLHLEAVPYSYGRAGPTKPAEFAVRLLTFETPCPDPDECDSFE
jgi:hypothetical protein